MSGIQPVDRSANEALRVQALLFYIEHSFNYQAGSVLQGQQCHRDYYYYYYYYYYHHHLRRRHHRLTKTLYMVASQTNEELSYYGVDDHMVHRNKGV